LTPTVAPRTGSTPLSSAKRVQEELTAMMAPSRSIAATCPYSEPKLALRSAVL
jgi:hypothetical protein